MECLGGYPFFVMTYVILLGGLQMRDEHGMLRGVYISCYDLYYIFCSLQTRNEHGMFRGYTFFVMTFVILSGGLKMRDEHGMLRGVYISRHQFCHTFR